jgi:hypothetical protein
MEPKQHYHALFAALVAAYGRLDENTLTGIIGFNAGGPVSMCTIERKNIAVTCELSLNPEQQRSAEGLKFEFLSLGAFDVETTRKLFTGLGALSMDAVLGDRHTVDVSHIVETTEPVVTLRLFSRTKIDSDDFGVYEIHVADT